MLRALHHMSTLVVSPSRHKKLLSVSTKAFAIAADSPNIVRSAYNVDIPRNIPLSHFILDAASKAKDKAVAFVDGVSGQELLFGELRGRIATAAAGFAARGVSSGDVVAVVLANCAEYAIVFHGASVAGGVVSPLNPSYTSFEIEHQLKDSGAKVVVTSSAFDATVRAAAGKLGIAVVTLGSPEAAFLAKADPQAELPPPPSDFSAATALAALPYSSGTTGLPKGVRLSHLNLIANILQVNAVPEHNCGHKPAGSVMLGVLPFFHIYGSTLILQSGLWLGAKVVTLPKFEPVTFLELLERHRVTFAPLVPPIIQMLARHPIVDKYDLSSLEIVFSGAAPLDADTQTLLQKRLPHVSVRQGYGLTESAPVTHLPDPQQVVPGSIGKVVAGMEAAIQAPDGTLLPPGKEHTGELIVRGPNVMMGYHNNPSATEKTIVDGWLLTGDIACRDANNNFFVVDRKKELIKVRGFQVAPAELEGILLQHPGVADVAVVARADGRSGEVPVAFVVAKQHGAPAAAAPSIPAGVEPPALGSPELAADIKKFADHRTAEYKHLAEVIFVAAIPKSASGKILRRVLRDSLEVAKGQGRNGA